MPDAAYLPLNIRLKDFKVLIVGGGHVATQKLVGLKKFSGNIIVVSPVVNLPVQKLAQRGKVKWIKRRFRKTDIHLGDIIYACTDDPKLNRSIAQFARKEKKLYNIAGQRKLSNFISPAVFKMKNLTISVSTSGTNPALSVNVRDRIARWFKVAGKKQGIR